MPSTMLRLPAPRHAPEAPGVLPDHLWPAPPQPSRWRLIAVVTSVGLASVWLLCEGLDRVQPAPWTGGSVVAWVVAVVVVVGLALSWVAARLPGLAPPLVVSATAVSVSGLAVLALHGTRWNFNALYSDAGFRTEAATRFADSPALADYGYRGLPSYYPPALPWVEGRLADLVDVPAWAMMKPVTIVLAALVPVLAYLLWRRVVPDLPAACVVAATTMATAQLTKVDEWLVLALLVPWWLELVRGVRRPGHQPWPVWAHGAVLGVLLLSHTYFFLPLGIATVVAGAVDLVRRRRLPLRPTRALAIGSVAVLVAFPSWFGMAVQAVGGAPGDHLQRRWSELGFTVPPVPVPTDVVGVLGLVGVGWLLLRTRTSRLAEALAVALGSAYALMVGGQWLQRADVALLPEKSEDLVTALLVASGVLGLNDLWWRRAPRLSRPAGLVLATTVAVTGAVLLTVQHADTWVTGKPVLAAQQMRYPEGGRPAGGDVGADAVRHPWSVSAAAAGPTVARVEDRWRRLTGSGLDSSTVLVTSRADLLATRPVHPFVPWKSIYSHPYGQFEARLQLLRRVSTCGGPQCARALLRGNRFDSVDGLVLNKTETGLQLAVATDDFPDAWRVTRIRFADELFTGPGFRRADIDGVAVVAVAPSTSGWTLTPSGG